jgi:uncharacterized membrane protein (DUF106 family)
MNLLQAINDWIVELMDPVMGWTLSLSMDVALVIVAVLTALVMTLIRRFTTDQAYLARMAADKKRLKQLIREAKKAKDKEAVGRHRATIGMIGMRAMKAEGMPVVVSLLPIVLLATWSFARLGYVPAEPGEPVKFTTYLSVMSVGEPVHLVPQAGLESDEPWIQQVREGKDDLGASAGVVTWTLRGEARDEPYPLTVASNGREDRVGDANVQFDGLTYTPPLHIYPGHPVIKGSKVDLQEFKLAGVVPGFPQVGLAPWLVGYLLLAVPLAFGFRWLLRVK